MEKNSKSRQIDTKPTKQVRIDAGLHKELKVRASKSGRTIKALVEESLEEYLAVDTQDVTS